MNTIKRAVFLSLLAAASALATTTYTQSVTSVTTVTITGATHGLGCSTFGVSLSDNFGVRKSELISGAPTINSSTYDVTVNFTTTFTGNVQLRGCFTAYSTAATDFQATISADAQTLYVCAVCTDSAPAVRDWGGNNYAAVAAFQVSHTSGTGTGTLYVWLDPVTHLLNFGDSGTTGNILNPSAGSVLTTGVTGFPTGVKALAHVFYYNRLLPGPSGGFWTVVDDR